MGQWETGIVFVVLNKFNNLSTAHNDNKHWQGQVEPYISHLL